MEGPELLGLDQVSLSLLTGQHQGTGLEASGRGALSETLGR